MAVLNGRKEEVDRLPAMNSVGTYTVEAMKTFDARWPAAHQDPEKMARLAMGLSKLAGLDNVTVPFELTLEAEVFGAQLRFFEDKIQWPSVKGFVAQRVSEVKLPSNAATAGRIPVVCDAIRILKNELDGTIPIIAYVNCPFTSIGSYLVDPVEFHKYLKSDPARVHEFFRELLPHYGSIAKAFKEAGADIITFREEGVSLDNISPKHFQEFVKPYLTRLISSVKPPRILHVCGTLISGRLEIIRNLMDCGSEALTMDEKTPMREAKTLVNEYKPSFLIGGNVSAMLIHKGRIDAIRNAVKRAVDEGADMVAPGCDFWIETPTEHVKAFVNATVEFGTRLGKG
jgi:[methyl-Co(III) methanol-specific corrinoid protein]:coenzyme M methyltransferase